MNAKPPGFRKHKTGVYFCRWGGQDHYFSKEREPSYQQYLKSLARWGEWRRERNTTRFPPLSASKPIFVAELVAKFLDYKEIEGGPSRRRFYANHLRRFANAFQNVHGSQIRANHLQAMKEDMIRAGYDPRTINHDLSCIKSLFNWASGMEIVPAVNLRFAKPLPLAPTLDRSLSRGQVAHFIKESPARIKPWLAINYLAMMRPSEVVRVVNGQGEWEEPWLFRLHKGKTDVRSQEHRRIVFSDAALAWLGRAEPHWTRQDSYYRCVGRWVDGEAKRRGDGARRLPYSPHVLRHSAATHLHELGAGRENTDLLLGHLPPRVSRTYVRIDWRSLREIVSQLTLPLDD